MIGAKNKTGGLTRRELAPVAVMAALPVVIEGPALPVISRG